MRLVDVLGTAWVGGALEGEGGVEDIILQSLFQCGIGAFGAGQDEARPDAVALNTFERPSGRRVGEHIAKVVEFVAKLDKLGSR